LHCIIKALSLQILLMKGSIALSALTRHFAQERAQPATTDEQPLNFSNFELSGKL
jgi:hypothetical protein